MKNPTFLFIPVLVFPVMALQIITMVNAQAGYFAFFPLINFVTIYIGLSSFLDFNNISDGRKKCEECKKRIGLFRKCHEMIMYKKPQKHWFDEGRIKPICKTCRQIKKLTE